MGKLYALGDLHLGYKANAEAIQAWRPHPDDGLILCGDVGETTEHLDTAFDVATRNFREVWWVPGNHELYTMPSSKSGARGEAKYHECVAVARRHGVHTPEDPFVTWRCGGGDDDDAVVVAPVFLLYDYSFRPANVSRARALQWAEEADTMATDEHLLHPDPYATRDEWCAALVAATERKLSEAAAGGRPLVLINHWPLREDLIYIPRVPRFTLWCGTKLTHDWHTRFNAKVVVSGHLHTPRTDWKDGVRFEECSLGYPRQWDQVRQSGKTVNELMREILPGPPPPESGFKEVQLRRWG